MAAPWAHIVSNLVGHDTLVEDVRAVLRDLVPRAAEVRTRAGTWFQMRIRPYRTLENVIEGAVITFIDITDLRREKANREVHEKKAMQAGKTQKQDLKGR